MYKIKVIKSPNYVGIEDKFDAWVESLKEDGLIPIIQQIDQKMMEYETAITILYRVQKENIQVETEKVIPVEVNDFKVTEFEKGLTLHFKLFLEERELDFLEQGAENLIFEGVPIFEFDDDIESLKILKSLRRKGVLQNFKNSDGKDVFMGTELAQYLWKSFLETQKS